MKNAFYKQCRLQQGNRETVSWIPSWAAKVGNMVQLITLDNKFWKVVSAGENVATELIKGNEKSYKDFQGSLKGGGID